MRWWQETIVEVALVAIGWVYILYNDRTALMGLAILATLWIPFRAVKLYREDRKKDEAGKVD